MTRTTSIHSSILERIGSTPLIELRSIVPEKSARILIKLESENPTGSMKDRMALAMIEAAERDGRLESGGNVVEFTDAFSLQKRDHMRALGAELTLVKSVDGGMDEALTRNMIEMARQIRERTGGFWTDQLNNNAMGEEIWRQTEGRVDAFVQCVGTAASVRGVAERLRDKRSDIHIVAVEPTESAVLSGHETGVHKIEGIGAGFVVPLWDPSVVDEVATVSTEQAKEMARSLAREEALLAGTSTGANLTAALRVAERLGSGATVVTVMCDSGIKYLGTDQYRGG